MARLTNVAFFRALPGKTHALGTALSALVVPTRSESGCLNYALHQSLDDAEVWFVYENWRSAEGLAAHLQTSHVRKFLQLASNLIAGDIDQRRFSLVSTSDTAGA